MILVLDTADNEEIFVGLWDKKWLADKEWYPGRNLSTDILVKLESLYKNAGKTLKNTSSIIVKSGPGSFTGLRIGISVANAMAYSLDIPIVGISKTKTVDKLLAEGKKL
jgi:tRNA threonylcarbamoyladenosine biosynthesis protein TsaB